MTQTTKIPKNSVNRLTVYLLTLKRLRKEGYEKVSSDELAKSCGTSAENVRKDLAFLGRLGKRSVGYLVEDLIYEVGKAIGEHKKWNTVIVGVGCSLWDYTQFMPENLNIVSVMDVDSDNVGRFIPEINIIVSHLDNLSELVKTVPIHIGVIAVAAKHTQIVVEKLIAAGAMSIYNLGPVNIRVAKNIMIINNNVSAGLSAMSYWLGKSGQVPSNTGQVQHDRMGAGY